MVENGSNLCQRSPRLIDSLSLPGGLKKLSIEQLTQLTAELRDELIDCISACGGHFASSLGAAEISVALHYLFDTPRDRLVWDVGHQAYVHKMLTGRLSSLPTIRQKDGISGFLQRGESEYDCFGAGHAGTSISAAVGMSVASQRECPQRFVVAVIGDAAIATGMAFEAMNNAGALALKKFIVVLNDNEMSISPNVGALSWLFSSAATSKTSTRLRARLKALYNQGYVPQLIYKAVDRVEEITQGLFSSASMLFEAFGFRYIGPVDGHNLEDLISALERAKEQDVPVLVHAITVKGKGYKPAEQDPIKWHGVTPFDRNKGQFIGSKSAQPSPPQKVPSYTSVFADTLVDIARVDPKVVGITAAMPSGTGLDRLQQELPHAFFDVGICEQHAVTFAAGLACEGFRPVCAIYSTFLQRAYDQVIHDVCLQGLPVVFAMDRAGAVGNDGETHQGLFDIAFLRTIPNLVLMSPKDENEFRHMLFTAIYHNGPVALRYPRGSGLGVALDRDLKNLAIGQAEILQQGEDVLMLCFGPLVRYALIAADRLMSKHGISSTVVNMRFAKPLDTDVLIREVPRHELVLSLEDHARKGGFGSAVLEHLNEQGVQLAQPMKVFGAGDLFVPHASQEEQHAMLQYDAESICRYVLSELAVLPGDRWSRGKRVKERQMSALFPDTRAVNTN